ncbi:MAG: hypothetical protein WBA22_09385 [Candidatus Methanofastidiosia archaeon]
MSQEKSGRLGRKMTISAKARLGSLAFKIPCLEQANIGEVSTGDTVLLISWTVIFE